MAKPTAVDTPPLTLYSGGREERARRLARLLKLLDSVQLPPEQPTDDAPKETRLRPAD